MTWTKADIRRARKRHLPGMLEKRNYRLIPLENDNFKIDCFGSLTIKENYWVWKEKNLSGNSIEFFMEVEKKTFFESMKIICEAKEKLASVVVKSRKTSELIDMKSIMRKIMSA